MTATIESIKTILIIDDDLDFHTLVGGMLRNSGYKIKSLLNGAIIRALSVAQKADMILLDIELPETNGIDVCQQLKQNSSTENIPIILISGHTEGDTLFKESQADAFMQKPFSLAGLLNKINELLLLAEQD
jgi:two-component system alkaline phosphatase synthesis response regulator PhoP